MPDKLTTFNENHPPVKNAMKILIVDDDEDDCYSFCEAVREIDPSLEYLVAHDGEEALTKIRTSGAALPDLIFLDLNMPRMNGLRCLVELKKDSQLRNIPVIILSTSCSPRDIEEAKVNGAAYFMIKPSKYGKLREEILFVIQHDWLDQPEILSS